MSDPQKIESLPPEETPTVGEHFMPKGVSEARVSRKYLDALEKARREIRQKEGSPTWKKVALYTLDRLEEKSTAIGLLLTAVGVPTALATGVAGILPIALGAASIAFDEKDYRNQSQPTLEEIMADGEHGITETVEVVDAAEETALQIIALVKDGAEPSDIPQLIIQLISDSDLRDKWVAAAEGIQQVDDEIGDIDVDEAEALISRANKSTFNIYRALQA